MRPRLKAKNNDLRRLAEYSVTQNKEQFNMVGRNF
jgi:hypothetical protein